MSGTPPGCTRCLPRAPGVSAALRPPATFWQPFGLASAYPKHVHRHGDFLWFSLLAAPQKRNESSATNSRNPVSLMATIGSSAASMVRPRKSSLQPQREAPTGLYVFSVILLMFP